MDVTPRELREIDFRTEWKGYHRDDVDDLLERAAATIEAQNERVRQVVERADALQAESAQAAPASRETEDMLRRTLVLAQRTADEAVAEAQTEARRITEEADTHARRVVSEAEANARRVAEGERQRLEAEVLDLGARREALLADVEQLERFANDYRARLRSAIERDLDTLATRPPVVDSPRPRLHEVDIPAGSSAKAGDDTQASPTAKPGVTTPPVSTGPPASTGPRAENAPATPEVAPRPTPTPFTPEAPAAREPSPSTAPNPAPPPAVAPAAQPAASAPTPPTASAPTPPVVRDEPASPPAAIAPAVSSTPDARPTSSEGERTIELDKAPPFPAAPAAGESIEAEVLDDDAFFASLREAVRDDSPLGPRPEDSEVNLDEDADGRFGNVFKRRR